MADREPIDPTANVLALVAAAIQRQDDLRAAESLRLADLAVQRDKYETRIADILREEVRSTSTLISTQLDRLTTAFNDRIAALERFRYEVGGTAKGRTDVFAWIITGVTVLLGAAATAITFIVRMH